MFDQVVMKEKLDADQSLVIGAIWGVLHVT